jgi:hypothetical protein
MAGRAGRVKLHDDFGRSIIIAQSPFEVDRYWRNYVKGSFGKMVSAFQDMPIESHVLNLIASDICHNENEIADFLLAPFSGTLYWDDPDSKQDVRDMVKEALKKAADYELISGETGILKITSVGKQCATDAISLETCRRIFNYLGELSDESFNTLKALFVAASVEDAEYCNIYYNSRQDHYVFSDLLTKTPSILLKEDQKRRWQQIPKVKTAYCMLEWIDGLYYRKLRDKYNTPAGFIKRCAEGLSWIMSSIANIANVLAFDRSIVDELFTLSNRLVFGLPAKALPLTPIKVRGLGRTYISRLFSHGYTSYGSILDANLDDLGKIIPKTTASRLQETIILMLKDGLDKNRSNHKMRMETIGRTSTIITDCYDTTGKNFSKAVYLLLKDVGFIVEYIEDEPNHKPDILLHSQDGTIVFECSSSETGYIGMAKSGEILSEGAQFNPIAFAVVGKPDFDLKAIENAEHIARSNNYKLIPISALCESIVMFYEHKLTIEQSTQLYVTETVYFGRNDVLKQESHSNT